jgi:hypothetical protein
MSLRTRYGQLGASALTAQHQQHTKNSIVLFSLQYHLFSQLLNDAVFILFGQMIVLHQIGFLGTSLKLFREHLQTFNRPYLSIKKWKISPQACRDPSWIDVSKKSSRRCNSYVCEAQWLRL